MFQGQQLSDRPPIGTGAAPVMPSPGGASGQQQSSAGGTALSPSTAAHAVSDTSTGVNIEAHAARMRGLPLDPAEDMLAGLTDWAPTAVRSPLAKHAPRSID